MRTDCNRVGWLMIWAATLLMSRVVEAEERSLARVAFWLPPERMAEFATVYEEKVVPLLHQRGLVASSKTGRATTDSVFSRLFELESPTSWREVNEAMSTDPAWQNLLKELGNSFGAAGSDSLMRSDFRLYSSPAGPGKSQAAGPGRTMEAGPGFPQELAGSGQTVLAGPGQTMPAGPGKTVLAGAGTTTPVKPRQPVRVSDRDCGKSLVSRMDYRVPRSPQSFRIGKVISGSVPIPAETGSVALMGPISPISPPQMACHAVG